METKQNICNLSLRLDLNDSTASLEKLKFWNPQNFTSILNKPNVFKIIFTRLMILIFRILLWRTFFTNFMTIKIQ